MAYVKVDRRNHTRYAFPSKIEYVLDPDDSDKIYKGVTINCSNTGLCLYVFNPVSEGQKITINSVLPVSSQTGTIRWSKKLEDRLFKVGLLFE